MSDIEIQTKKRSVPLQKGLTEKDATGKDRLIASRCNTCDLVFFPQRKYCGKCGCSDQPTFLLEGTGTVYAFSLIDRKSQYTLIEPPYIQAEIAMPEGVHVFTVLDGCDLDTVTTGMAVETYVDTVSQDNEGNDVVAYKFKPVNRAQKP